MIITTKTGGGIKLGITHIRYLTTSLFFFFLIPTWSDGHPFTFLPSQTKPTSHSQDDRHAI